MNVDWNNWQPKVRATLLFLLREIPGAPGREVLLIRKKRGLGAGKVNGPGGKMDPGESPEACAVRETREELHVTALDPERRGLLRFQFTDGLSIHCVVFVARRFTGTATETEEAIPMWTPVDAIPYDQMWEDDRHWLPGALSGRTFDGRFLFDQERMLQCDLTWERGAGGV